MYVYSKFFLPIYGVFVIRLHQIDLNTINVLHHPCQFNTSADVRLYDYMHWNVGL